RAIEQQQDLGRLSRQVEILPSALAVHDVARVGLSAGADVQGIAATGVAERATCGCAPNAEVSANASAGSGHTTSRSSPVRGRRARKQERREQQRNGGGAVHGPGNARGVGFDHSTGKMVDEW